ncbi:MAG: hypothetical protein H0T60_01140 [Acidobacteria bacterium]|nr:hypothetical protein [Acidobacteriota bacterium]
MVQEAHKIITLEELKGRTLEELLHEVAQSRQPITVILEEGESVTIEPSSQLKPLPQLEGHVPEGWKNAIS